MRARDGEREDAVDRMAHYRYLTAKAR
jgi:hypothetical protein